jgi:agmatine deiminase
VFYYIHAEASNGKEQVRPMPAPSGYWKFNVLSTPTGISEVELSVGVFPNPSTGQFNINFDRVDEIDYSVFDVTGKQIFSESARSKAFVLNLENYGTGLYLLKLEWEGGTKTIRLQVL